jgi:hypothetical protein
MEYCNKARFLEERLLEQHKEFKDENELRKYIR